MWLIENKTNKQKPTIDPIISITTPNIDGLNAPIRSQILSEQRIGKI